MGWEWACTVEMRGGGRGARERGDETKGEWGRQVNIRKMRRVVELLKEGSDRPSSSLFY